MANVRYTMFLYGHDALVWQYRFNSNKYSVIEK